MNILLVEDRGSISVPLKDTLSKKHNVFLAKNIEQAKEHIEDNEFDLLITDLNMSPSGLTEEEINETKGGKFTGWIWLKNYVFENKPYMKKNTIIFSDYTDELETDVQEQEVEGIIRIKKSDPASPFKQLIEAIAKHEEAIESKTL